jgi:hypothetical protein
LQREECFSLRGLARSSSQTARLSRRGGGSAGIPLSRAGFKVLLAKLHYYSTLYLVHLVAPQSPRSLRALLSRRPLLRVPKFIRAPSTPTALAPPRACILFQGRHLLDGRSEAGVFRETHVPARDLTAGVFGSVVHF